MKKTFYTTTPIYYASGKLHIGSSYTTLFCDYMKRYKNEQGYDTHFLTGMDEHGQKVAENAVSKGLKPQEHVDKLAESAKKMWDTLGINYDDFIRTTEDRHKIVVQKVFDKLLEKGDIYSGEYEGHYCMPCESYFTKTQLLEGDKCPDCGRDTKVLKEKSYFLKLSKYQDKLLKFIKDNPKFIQPETRKNEVVSFIEQGLNDLSVSRTSFDWGIKVPNDEKHVVYVWIDALTNYISALGYSQDETMFNKYWQGDEVLHVVGKDILRFHAIYWPIILMALEVDINFELYAHGWILMKDGKMSKSRGNVVYADDLIEKYNLDSVRYYLLRELPYGNDGVFTPESFVQRVNVDLTNDYGNLVNRTAAMVKKYFDSKVSKIENKTEFDSDLINTTNKYVENFHKLVGEYKISKALEELFKIVSRTNKYIDETAPWVLAKDESKKDVLQSVMYNLCENIRIINILSKPVLIESNKKVVDIFSIKNNDFNSLIHGTENEYTVAEKIEQLFPRLEVEKEVEYITNLMIGDTKKMEKPETKEIEFDQFMDVDIRVGTILECENHPKADRLLVSQVDLGYETRQIVSGIKSHYKKEDMIGKKVLVVTNLKPIKLRGVESAGMILAGSNDEGALEVIEASQLTNGSVVK